MCILWEHVIRDAKKKESLCADIGRLDDGMVFCSWNWQAIPLGAGAEGVFQDLLSILLP